MSVDLLRRKISSFLQPFKDDLGLRAEGVSAVTSALGRHASSIYTRLKEHHRHIRIEHADESAVAKQNISLVNRIQLLSTKPRYMDRIIC
jgi:hypothetical protein